MLSERFTMKISGEMKNMGWVENDTICFRKPHSKELKSEYFFHQRAQLIYGQFYRILKNTLQLGYKLVKMNMARSRQRD